jgi:hypothetical protein
MHIDLVDAAGGAKAGRNLPEKAVVYCGTQP